jgi:hypothetical protein
VDSRVRAQDQRELAIEGQGLGGAEQSEYAGPAENTAFLQSERFGESGCTLCDERGWMLRGSRGNSESALAKCPPRIDCDELPLPGIQHVPEAEVSVQDEAVGGGRFQEIRDQFLGLHHRAALQPLSDVDEVTRQLIGQRRKVQVIRSRAVQIGQDCGRFALRASGIGQRRPVGSGLKAFKQDRVLLSSKATSPTHRLAPRPAGSRPGPERSADQG